MVIWIVDLGCWGGLYLVGKVGQGDVLLDWWFG